MRHLLGPTLQPGKIILRIGPVVWPQWLHIQTNKQTDRDCDGLTFDFIVMIHNGGPILVSVCKWTTVALLSSNIHRSSIFRSEKDQLKHSLIAEKRNERYNDVMAHLRTELSFTMLRSVLISIRGARGKKIKGPKTPQAYLSYNLIQERTNYESY